MLNVMTWNVKHSTPAADVITAVEQVVDQFEVDVLCLQEVRLLSLSDGWSRLPSRLAKATGMRVAFALHPIPNGTWWEGLAILSRRPIVEQRSRLLSWHRRYLDATIRCPRFDLVVGCVHISALSPRLRAREVERLQRMLPPRQSVVAGDFNLLLGDPVMNGLKQRLESDRCAGGTYGRSGKKRKIDHIFASRDLLMQPVATLAPSISDHSPVLVRVG